MRRNVAWKDFGSIVVQGIGLDVGAFLTILHAGR